MLTCVPYIVCFLNAFQGIATKVCTFSSEHFINNDELLICLKFLPKVSRHAETGFVSAVNLFVDTPPLIFVKDFYTTTKLAGRSSVKISGKRG